MVQSFPVARRQVTVNNVLGLHLRVAGRFVKLADKFQCEVLVHCKGIMADGGSVLSLLSLAAECGTMLALEAQGCDAEDAVAALLPLSPLSPPRLLCVPLFSSTQKAINGSKNSATRRISWERNCMLEI